jgi:uncharacterized protein
MAGSDSTKFAWSGLVRSGPGREGPAPGDDGAGGCSSRKLHARGAMGQGVPCFGLRAPGPRPILRRMKIAYLNGPRLRRSLIAACDYTESRRRELNRINVFPVPDGDTGTNLALTVRAIADHLRRMRHPTVGKVAREAAEAAVLGARGNSGMMLSHFLLGFADEVGDRARIEPADFGAALSAGVRSLYAAIDHPVEGTILTVMRETAEAAETSAESDFHGFLEEILDAARSSLERTPDLLPALREAGVVDAGAKGFVHLLEGVVTYIVEGQLMVDAAAPPLDPDEDASPAAAAHAAFQSAETYRFCTEGLVRGESLPDEETVRAFLRDRGDSIVVIRTGNLLKVHVHTDEPEAVFQWLRGHGTLATHKAEDMQLQHATVARSGEGALARRPVAFVTESAQDLPDEVLRAHGIGVVPLLLLDGDQVLRDGIDITPEAFHARLSTPGPLPTTSQPAPADFLRAFERAAEEGETILYLGLSSALSGTFASAEAAAARFSGATTILRFDTRAASILQGMLVLHAAELAESGVPAESIPDRLRAARDASGIFFTVDTFDRLLASGRVGRGKALLGRLLDVKPILELGPDGRIAPFGKARGREAVEAAVLAELLRRVPPGSAKVRFGLVHVGRPDVVARLEAGLRDHYGPDTEVLTGPVTPVLATHLGAGAWGVGWLVEPAAAPDAPELDAPEPDAPARA